MVGEAIGEVADLATLARALTIIGDVGNVAMTVYDTVSTKGNDVEEIMGLLMGFGGMVKATRNEKGLRDIALKRSGLSAEKIEKFGAIFKKHDGQLQKILRKVC